MLLFVPFKSPSVYSTYRKRALNFALDSALSCIENNSEPLYMYGDFNFRLDFAAVVKVRVTHRFMWDNDIHEVRVTIFIGTRG